jgi:hypothetical protein
MGYPGPIDVLLTYATVIALTVAIAIPLALVWFGARAVKR